MRFARVVFRAAGVFGIVAAGPLYLLWGEVGRRMPPPVTHPQFYFGFAGVVLAWSWAFFVIAGDPKRFRPLMLPSVFEKSSYVAAMVVLYLGGNASLLELATAGPDLVFAGLFLAAFVKTRELPKS